MIERESLVNPRLWLAFATMLLVSGIGNTFPVFFPPPMEEFGGSRAATALAVTLIWVGGAMLAPFAGHMVDRWSPRAIVAVGLLTIAAGLTVAALAPTLRVFATGIAFAGSMAGYVMATPAHWVITSFSWRATLGAYVAAILMLVPWVWCVYPRRLASDVAVAPAAHGAMGALARTPAFWARASARPGRIESTHSSSHEAIEFT